MLREGANINRSLLALGNCISALSRAASAAGRHSARAAHVPFRDSCLTRLLRGSLAGNCRTVMVATVSAAPGSLEDTANTLKYAAHARRIRVARMQNVANVRLSPGQYEALVAELRAEIERLKLLSNELKSRGAKNSSVELSPAKRTFKYFSSAKSDPLVDGSIDSEVAKVEDAQASVWRLKRKKLLLGLQGRAVKTRLQYWTKRKAVLFSSFYLFFVLIILIIFFSY